MTFDDLKSQISDWLPHTDIFGKVGFLIELSEARHQREVRIREMLTRSALTVDNRFVSLPADFLEMKTLRLLTNPLTVLQEISLHEMNRVRRETTGQPDKFTVHAQIEFDVAPDSAYSGEIIFYKALTALSAANPTNALLTRAPDVYLYGTLMAAEPFLLNDERVKLWASLYTDAVSRLNKLDLQKAGPLIARVVGATP